MTKRPTAKVSQLAGATPVRPVDGPVAASKPSVAPETAMAAVAPVNVASTPVGPPRDADKPKKEGYYMRPSDKERAERARMTTSIHTGLRTWTAYVNEAVMAYTKELEKQHNDSKPF